MKKILLAILALSILGTSPLVYERMKTELGNQVYEVVVPYDEIDRLQSFGIDVYPELEGIVQTISIEPTLTLSQLEEKNIVDVYEKQALALIPEFADIKIVEDSGLYIVVKGNNGPLKGRIEQAFGQFIQREQQLDEHLNGTVYFIKGFHEPFVLTGNNSVIQNPILTLPLGFDHELVAQLHERGFAVIFRLSDSISDSNLFIFDDLVHLNEEYGFHKILFSGNTALSLENDNVKQAMTDLKDKGFVLMPIEFNNQKGFAQYEKLFGNQMVRLHSIDPFDGRNDYVERASRAVFERNIRALYIHVNAMSQLVKPPEEIEPSFMKAVSIIEDTHEAIANQKFASLTPGISTSYPDISSSKIMRLVAVVGLTAFIGLAALKATMQISILSMLGVALIGIVYALTNMNIIAQGLALIVTVVAATYSVISAERMENKSIIFQYVKSAAIAFVGAWFAIVLLYGSEYLLKFEEFRGVKVLLALPIVLVALHLMKNYLVKISLSPVRYYQVALLGLALVVVAIYLMRSGNTPVVGASGAEMLMRELLENTLGVRPRTKEFLIGFPLFILALYLLKKGYKWAVYIHIAATIGFTSMVNTFTHLHIPIHISIIRSLYGLLFGALIGIVLIILFELLRKYVWPKLYSTVERVMTR